VRSVEADIDAWRTFVDSDGNGCGTDALETELRDQIARLTAAGLTDDEAFVIAVKRMGQTDERSRAFARRHRGRLWHQLVHDGEDGTAPAAGGWAGTAVFAVAAAACVQLARLAAGFPAREPGWLPRTASLFVLPFLAGWFARRRGLGVPACLPAVAAFVIAALAVNVYPWAAGSGTERLVVAHLPVALWFVVAHPYCGGDLRSAGRRMDFVRFSGEWGIHYALIALGGGVLTALTVATLEPAGVEPERITAWMLPSGAAGAVLVAAWLVESRQRVVESLAPLLTMVFTPLFALTTTATAVVYAITGPFEAFDRELLGVFDALLVAVVGLVLYGVSAREPSPVPGWMDRTRLVAIAAALLLDAMVLTAIAARIGDLGVTPNRVAALGLNLVLLVNLAGSGWYSARFLAGRGGVGDVERWQVAYLPVVALWVAAVVLVLPPLFSFG